MLDVATYLTLAVILRPPNHRKNVSAYHPTLKRSQMRKTGQNLIFYVIVENNFILFYLNFKKCDTCNQDLNQIMTANTSVILLHSLITGWPDNDRRSQNM
jgi:hypothetical protein